MKIIFFGTPYFAQQILKDLLFNNFNVVAVVTRPDQPQGRSLKLKPSAVKQFIVETGLDIPLFQPVKASQQEFVDVLKTFNPDFFVVVGYGEILRQNLLDVPLKAPINIHTSLLPKYRGAAPIQRAIMAGEKEIGVTIMQMNAQMDAGEILMQKSMNISMDETFEQIEKSMIANASVAICEVLSKFNQYKINSKRQDISLITHAPKIEAQDCKIDFEKSAFTVQRQIMALSPKPSAWINVELSGQIKRIKILNASFSNKIVKKGFLEIDGGDILLGCQDGSLSINLLQPEGKSVVVSKDFINGHKIHFPIKILF